MEEIVQKKQTTASALSDSPAVKPLEPDTAQTLTLSPRKTVIILLAVCLLGVVTGYFIYIRKNAGMIRLGGQAVEIVKTPTEEGVKDASTFRDTATGKLIENDGKITNEGSHILIRGDTSQNAYLTSSVIDLSKYVGKKVQVWGETFQGQKAGWLMDVGRIKVL